MSSIGDFVPLRRTFSGLDYGERAVVMTPSIQLDEIRTVPGELIPGGGNPKAPCHRAELGPRRYAHRSLHLCSHVSVGLGLPRRDLPVRQEVSVALGDQQRDWDFLGHQVPADGGNWFIAVNDRVCPVRDQGGWDFHKRAAEQKSGWMHRFTLPLDALRENAWNTLAVGCSGAGNEFLCFKGDGQASVPEEPCFCAEVNS